MKVILFSTHCPKCMVLQKKLQAANIGYDENFNVDEMLEMGIRQAPVLKVDDELLDFSQAVAWLASQGG